MDTVFVGVLRVVLHIPHARSLKDGRAVVLSLRDRVRHKFDVAVHEIEMSEMASRRVLVVTTAGNDARLIRSILDRVRQVFDTARDALVAGIDVDVFQWHPPGQEWMAGIGADPAVPPGDDEEG